MSCFHNYRLTRPWRQATPTWAWDNRTRTWCLSLPKTSLYNFWTSDPWSTENACGDECVWLREHVEMKDGQWCDNLEHLQMQNLIYEHYQKINSVFLNAVVAVHFLQNKLLNEFHEENLHLIQMFLQYHSLYLINLLILSCAHCTVRVRPFPFVYHKS